MSRIVPIVFVLLFSSHGWGEDCRKAIDLYNQATRAGDLELRERSFREAIPLCSDPEVLSRVDNNLADTYERSGRLSLALAYYQKALEAKSDLATSYFSVGDIFFRLEDYHSAAVMYGKGLKYGPADEESRRRREEAEARARSHMVVYFDFDSFRVSGRYVKRLDVVGEAIKEHGIDSLEEITVIGHSCSLGPSAYNRCLSLRRAEEVARYLEGRFSVDPGVVMIVAEGEDVPLLPGLDRNARVLNRRAEIRVRFKEE